MLTLISLTALAAPVCEPTTLTSSQPADGATDVSPTLAPMLAFEGFCGGDSTFAVTITPQGETTPAFDDTVATDLLTGPGGVRVWEGPSVTLEADTTYDVAVQGLTDGWTFSFTTGTAAATPVDPASILLAVDAADGYDQDQVRLVDATVSLDRPAGTPAILRFEDRELLLMAPGVDRATVTIATSVAQVCFTPTVRGLDGDWVDGAPACADVVDDSTVGGGGCSTGASEGWTLGLAGLFARR
ncbi:MAG: hypothetical protein KC656_05240 [Myxococcales bacterium]|nr:hypothetical protein [Myxococcales bacterium]MCB9693961.1 hypothetical protein [Alphaproteobacteria bacterium]